MKTSIWAIIVTLIGSFIGAYGAILLKKSASEISFTKLKFNRDLIIGVAIYGLSTIMFIIALRFGELSILYPVVATTYAWIALFSIYFLKEHMNSWKWAGIFAILIGVTLIGIAAS
jgi:uncharacterized membrane protein